METSSIPKSGKLQEVPREFADIYTLPLGGSAQIGLVTPVHWLHLNRKRRFLRKSWHGVPVIKGALRSGFCDLYFFALIEVSRLNPDGNSVKNCERLWQRLYTTREILHQLDCGKVRVVDECHSGVPATVIQNGDGPQTIFSYARCLV